MENNTNLITLDTAIELINANFTPIDDYVCVSLSEAVGRVLTEDVHSDIDMPPFDKSAMDGYACRREDLEKALEIIEIIPAGTEPSKSVKEGECSKIMTGAKVPTGANCVVMIEQTSIDTNNRLVVNPTKTGTNICPQGEDIKKGNLVLRKGTLITPQIVATLASVGKTELKVVRKPSIGFFCTGSELVEPDVLPTGVHIRNSNAAQLTNQIQLAGAVFNYYGIVSDKKEEISSKIDEVLASNDIIIITGGASVGDFDFIPQILKDLGFQLHFSKISIQPGKPVLYATYENKHIFGLSGNPVSSFLQFELLVKPLLLNLSKSSKKIQNINMVSGEYFSRKNAERSLFLPVMLNPEGQITKANYHGSAHIAGLVDIFGFLIMEKGITEIKQGEIVNVRPL